MIAGGRLRGRWHRGREEVVQLLDLTLPHRELLLPLNHMITNESDFNLRASRSRTAWGMHGGLGRFGKAALLACCSWCAIPGSNDTRCRTNGGGMQRSRSDHRTIFLGVTTVLLLSLGLPDG
jgi:hypothetical protein